MKSEIMISARALYLDGYTRDQVFDELSLNYIDYGWNSTMILASAKWGIPRSEFRVPITGTDRPGIEANRFDRLRTIVDDAFNLWEENS